MNWDKNSDKRYTLIGNVVNGVARVLRALVQRYVMGPLVTKQLTV